MTVAALADWHDVIHFEVLGAVALPAFTISLLEEFFPRLITHITARPAHSELFSKVVDWRNEKGGVSFRVVS